MKRAVIAQTLSISALSVALVLGAGAAGSVASVSLDVDDFTFASFDADYFLERADDGSSQLRTVETLVAEFPQEDQNRGIIRAIPNDYDGIDLETAVESIVDEDGVDVPFEEESDDGFLVLALGTDDYVRGDQTYVITYTQTDVVRFFEDTDSEEFQWDTNGTGYEQPFGTLDARVHIDEALVPALTGNAACYVGEQGSTDTCELVQSTDDAGAVFTAAESNLGAGENVTVAIGFTPGTFDIPEPPTAPAWANVVTIGLSILALLVAIGGIIARVTGPKDAPGRGTIIPEYSVPENLNLLIAGDLVGRASSGLPAQIVSLAVRGNVLISEQNDDYTLVYVDNRGVDEQEQNLLDALFGSSPHNGMVRDLSETNATLGTALRTLQSKVRPATIARGLRVKTSLTVAKAFAALSYVVLALSVVTLIVLVIASPVVPVWAPLMIVIAVFAAIIASATAISPALLTAEGATARDYLRGMKVYLELAEEERFRMLQSPTGALRVDTTDRGSIVKVYEKLLPFAVLWGVEQEWAKELAIKYGDEAPQWYVGSGGFNPVLFAAGLHGLSSSASAATSYGASGSGSSAGGSMGGGFSGGGGGGGGGGGR